MASVEDKYELTFREVKIKVERHYIGTQTIFRIVFSNKIPPLVIARAVDSNAYKFWTSIPEGRQQEAEELGALISEYYKFLQ